MNYVNANLISFQHLKFIVVKVVPRMGLGSLGLQYWIHNHVLPVSYVWEHHMGSLNRTKVVLISKLCVVTHAWPLDNIKIVPENVKI